MADLGNTPEFPEPLAVRLDEVHLLKDNSLRVWFEFEEGTMLCVEIPPDSDAMTRILGAIVGATTEVLSAVGERGLEIVGFTESDPEEDEQAEDEEDEE